MALRVPAKQDELVTIGNLRAHFRMRGNGTARLVIEGLKSDDVVRIAGVDVQIKPAHATGSASIHATGPREIPIRATGILTDPDEEAKLDGAGGGE